MTYEAYLNGEYAGPAATVKGWGNFGRWTRCLPEDQYPTLSELEKSGRISNAHLLAGELRQGMQQFPPREAVRSTAEGLLGYVGDASEGAVLEISDGTADDADNSDPGETKSVDDEPRDERGRWTSAGSDQENRVSEFSAEQGGKHYDSIVLPPRTDGPNVKYTGPGEFDYELKTEDGSDRLASNYRAIYPDEPHTVRDITWPQIYGKGGGAVDTSPENPRVPEQVFKFWATSGFPVNQKNGINPHHHLIRAAADRILGIHSTSPDPKDFGKTLKPEEYDNLARKLIEGIKQSPAEQPTLWRGIGSDQLKALESASPGDEVQWSLASTSRDPNIASTYSTSGILRIKSGSKGIAVRSHYPQDQEVISGGRYKILGFSKTRDGVTVVDVEQTGVHQ